MENRIDQKFAELKAQGKKGFVAYITAGDPNLEATEDIVYRLEAAGADFIELGVPFSDPLADGPTNQMAAERAIENGTTLDGIFAMVERIRTRSQVPLVFFSYMNPLVAPGFEATVQRAKEVGIDGVLLVDCSLEEGEPYHEILGKAGLHNIHLVTPTTPDERIKLISDQSSGFLYCVSRTGVTGAQQDLQEEALGLLNRVHEQSPLPVALGFGVSTPEQAKTYAEITEAVVVGSFIVKTYHEAGDSDAGREAATEKVKALIDAVKSV